MEQDLNPEQTMNLANKIDKALEFRDNLKPKSNAENDYVITENSLLSKQLGQENKVIENSTNVKKDNFWPITGFPSKCVFYPAGIKIMARPLNVMEIKLLSTINENNVNSIINQILERTVKGIEIKDLVVADKLFIIFWLRANTYKNDGYKVDFICTECNKEATYEFDLNKLSINYIKDNIDLDKEMITPNGVKFKVRYLTVENENQVSNFLKSYKGVEALDEDLLNMVSQIEEINGKRMTLLQKYDFIIRDCEPSDYSYIESYLKHINFGVNPVMNIECNKCGGTSPVMVSFRSDFFIPTYSFE